jgi:hypothetical protein
MIAPKFVVWLGGLISFRGESAEKPAKTKYCSKYKERCLENEYG